MTVRRPFGGGSGAGGLFGAGRGPVAPDLLWLLGVVFVTFSLRFFESTSDLIRLLELSPSVWQRGFIWQVATFPFVGQGSPGIWFLLELLILFWFGRDIRTRLGRHDFWRVLGWGIGVAAVTAVGVEIVARLMGGGSAAAFSLLQGQRTLIMIVIAAFATLYAEATILLFFVLPIQAKWFLLLEILFAFMGFLASGDLAGFVGIVAAVAMIYDLLSGGALRRVLREKLLRAEQRRLKAKLGRMRKKRGLKLVDPDSEPPASSRDDPWIH